jgi:hypothetical protein
MDATDRAILDHYKEGIGLRTIALRTGLDLTEVQAVVQDLAGGDRTRAAALVAEYDKEHGTAPAGAPRAGGRVKAPQVKLPHDATTADRKATTAAQPAEDTPATPTVVPVDLSEVLAADVPAPAEPAPAAPAARAADLPLERCTHGGDCTVHPGVGQLHNFDEPDAELAARAAAELKALNGPTDELPDVHSVEELMDAVVGVPELAQLAEEVDALVDRLHDAYARERKARTVRSEAAILRRELDTRLASLARLADPAALPAAAAA